MSTGAGGMSERKRALLELLIRQERDGADVDHRINRRLDSGPAPLSYAQQRLWLLEQLQPGTSIYTVRAAVRLGESLDATVLARSLGELARRHASLRTTFAVLDAKPVQLVAPPGEVPLTVVDIDATSQEQRDRLLWVRANEEADHRFDLAVGPLFRATLLRDGSIDPVVLLTMHHIVADGWSIGIVLRDLATIHAAFSRGEPSPLPELAIQYVDYAVWQHRSSSSGVLREQLTYWTRQLDQLPPLDLPWSRPRPAVPDLAGGREHVVLSEQATAALAELGRREGTTLFMTLIAAWQLVLGRLSGQDDFGIGTPIANRTRAETEGIVGFFLNTLVLRADLGGDPTVRELLARVRETTVQAFTHQDLPFERLLEALQPPRDPSRTPLFQVFLNLLNFADERLNQPVAFAEAPPAHEYAQFDLSIYAGVQEGRLQLQLVYRTDLYEAVVARRLLGCLRTVLEQLPVDLGRRVSAVSMLPSEELRRSVARRRVVRPDVSYQRFEAAEVEQSVLARFAAQARRYPDRIAIQTVRATWTYGQLQRWVGRTAALIRETAQADARRVAVLCGHDAPMVVALLASLEAGLAYVPLDPAHPVDRLTELIDDAQVDLVLTDRGSDSTARQLAGPLPVLVVDDAEEFADAGWADAGQADADLDPGWAVSPDAIAYLLYTSGTTGRPKGVVQSHRNLLHHVRAYTNSLQLRPQDRLALLASYGFDAAVMDIYGALLNGAGLCLYDVRREGLLGVARWLVDQRITVYHSTPTVFRQVFGDAELGGEAGELTKSVLRMVVLGGEEMRAADRDLFVAATPADCLLVNGLGPTESTLALQLMLDHDTPVEGRTVPVGYPVEDTRVLVLNESGVEVEAYGVGRLVVESRHLALGYWRRPEQTRAVFRTSVTDPAARRYETGDLCRRLPDGSIEYAGRRDRQLKIRGQRVEAGEVEAQLVAHPAVSDALVDVVDAPSASPELGPMLVGYVQCRRGCSVTSDELQAQLRRTLPAHMVPAAIVTLEALPVTVNGKADRRTLPIPDLSTSAAGPLVAPRTGLERTLAGLFGSVLGRPEVGVTDDFFALGGHSLLATQLLSRVRSTLRVELSLRMLFEHPTVAALAAAIEHQNPPPSTPLG